MNDDAIVALLTGLARPHSSGGQVVERAAIVAGTSRATQRFVLPAGVLSGDTARSAPTTSNAGRT
jgi:hypothetical protein